MYMYMLYVGHILAYDMCVCVCMFCTCIQIFIYVKKSENVGMKRRERERELAIRSAYNFLRLYSCMSQCT